MTYPEHDKLQKIMDQSQTCGEFLDWLQSKGYFLCQRAMVERENIFRDGYHEVEDTVMIGRSTTDLLAEFFDIDRAVLEQEKLQMLEVLRR